jgi:hypothetical protein
LFSWALRGVPFTEEVIRIRSSKKWRLYFGIRAVLLRDKRKVGRLVLRVNVKYSPYGRFYFVFNFVTVTIEC